MKRGGDDGTMVDAATANPAPNGVGIAARRRPRELANSCT